MINKAILVLVMLSLSMTCSASPIIGYVDTTTDTYIHSNETPTGIIVMEERCTNVYTGGSKDWKYGIPEGYRTNDTWSWKGKMHCYIVPMFYPHHATTITTVNEEKVFGGYTFGTSDCNRMAILSGQPNNRHAWYMMEMVAWEHKKTASQMFNYCIGIGADMTPIVDGFYVWSPIDK